jgi:alkanesulfonate monooxygenase SsuD/methylene tetrahydromethanopterin reductase-like flavin-dependent oxidoreductase (luciferase family)
VPAQGLTFGLKASQQHSDVAGIREIWTAVDDGGYDSLWLFDHFVPMGRSREGDIFEAWTMLAAMAEVTSNVRIGSVVTGNIYRHPGILAKMAVTVDHLSGGRLNMGIGAGGDELADAMLGIPTRPAKDRIAALDEACQVLKLLWTEPTSTFNGEHYQLTDALADPKPIQRPHPPLWIGSSGERYGLRVVAKHADVWMNAMMFPEVGELTRLSGVLDRHCEEVGRDPATIRRAVQFMLPADADETMKAAEGFVEAGFTDLIFMPFFGGIPLIEQTAALLPKLRTLG